MENLGTALGLLFIGMIMVVIVLWLVVLLGGMIITLTNKYVKDNRNDVTTKKNKKTNTRKIAAITAAVDVITQGQGRVESIQKKK